jgi:putative ABC transport system permease protein
MRGEEVRPPALPGRLLAWLDHSGAIGGDLDEEFKAHVLPRVGRRRAILWYWRQVITSIPRLLINCLATVPADMRAAARAVIRRPATSLLVVATLSIAMGANTAVYSVAHAILLKPLPFAHQSRLVRINPDELFYINLEGAQRFAERADAFDMVVPWGRTLLLLTDGLHAEEVRGGRVDWPHFDMLGVEPLLGRTFVEADADSAATVAILSHGLWQRRYGADPDIIGTQLRASSGTVTVIGVLKPDHVPSEADWQVWTVLPTEPAGYDGALAINARLRPGTSIDQGAASTRAAFASMAAERGNTLTAEDAAALRTIPLRDHLLGDATRPLTVLLGAVVALLLLGCVNVMNLLLAQGSTRAAECAMRLALGASRLRIISQFLMEATWLAAAGAANGLLLAWLLVRWGNSELSPHLPRTSEITLSPAVFLYAGASLVVAVLVAGLVPAVRVTGRSIRTTLAGSSRSVCPDSGRLSAGLVMAQVTLSMALVIGAALMMRSMTALTHVDPGFDPAGAVAVRVTPPAGRYQDADALDRLYATIQDAAVQSPAISRAGSTMFLPMTPGGAWTAFRPVNDAVTPADELPSTSMRIVTPGYFSAMNIAVRDGRAITGTDRSTTTAVAVINETLAREAFGSVDPVGHALTLGRTETYELRVVGVVADVRQSNLRTASHAELYVPLSQSTFPRMFIVGRATGRSSDAIDVLRASVAAVEPDAVVTVALALEDVVASTVGDTRILTLVMGGFGGVALLLCLVGVYGVTAHTVAQRSRDIGIRLALGADRRQVVAQLVSRGLIPVALGMTAGLALAMAGTSVLGSLLFDVTPTDPVSFAAAPLLLLLTATLALFLPASRTSRIDPARTLRE